MTSAPRDSVLQQRLSLFEMIDVASFREVVRGFVELYRIGIKVFDDRGGKLADIKIGNGDFCGYAQSSFSGECLIHLRMIGSSDRQNLPFLYSFYEKLDSKLT